MPLENTQQLSAQTDRPVLSVARHRADWFSQIYERYLESAVRGARAVLPSNEDALDVAQTIFARLWSRGPIPGRVYTSGYFARSARNEALNVKNRRSRGEAVLAAARMHGQQMRLPDQVLYAAEIDDLVADILERMPPRCQEVARLRYESRLAASEIGMRLGITEKAVRKQLARARRYFNSVHRLVQGRAARGGV